MVGRRWAAGSQKQQDGWLGNGHTNGGHANGKLDHRREYGISSKPRNKPANLRFRDATNKIIDDRRREEIKNKLIEEVDREQFEEFRKSGEFIKGVKSKKLRRFYEKQNEALNDWLEVDTAVRFIADDIFESFDPDHDHDGIIENGGALQTMGEDVEAFLPDEEREKRAKQNRRAKWAINVWNMQLTRQEVD